MVSKLMTGFKGPFASKPAPTLARRCSHILCSPPIQCGSGLAREGCDSVLEPCWIGLTTPSPPPNQTPAAAGCSG
ncbi:hypothetical protein EPZ47_19600 [Pseudomonas viciae]|uniref:Uncharacterized protein n=1 Tax=Pseudomonas viciae TaxID=2505979 RepID=A0A4P7PJ39_9PSED|nr:hypothetical protein EPZ47_19600 [Pseudomonas viciae]